MISRHETSRLELLDRHPTPLWEEKHIPILVPHGGGDDEIMIELLLLLLVDPSLRSLSTQTVTRLETIPSQLKLLHAINPEERKGCREESSREERTGNHHHSPS